MIRALYTAASGMMVENRRLDLMANNLANGQTPGFKSSDLVRSGQPATRGALASDVQTAHAGQYFNPSPGILRPTGAPFDFALEGSGYFALEAKGGTAYTRNGHFQRHLDGSLTDATGNAVLGEKGPIRLPAAAKVLTAEDGTLYADGKVVDRLKVVDFADGNSLQPTGTSLLYPRSGAAPAASASRVVGQSLEDSNVSSVSEMARMVETVRAFESYQKVIQTVMDDVTSAAVNRLGKIA